ncbi:MAG TPA: ABC transporter ATP-binding protein [Planctomycetota bacterium]|nr:ABC transporter ATP-binding protein [Planctomycetota bacterium]
MTRDWAEEEIQGRAYDGRLMRRFLAFIGPHRGLVGLTFLFLAGRVACELAGPFLLMKAVDGPIARGDLHGLGVYAVLFLGTILGTGAAEYGYTMTMNLVGQRVLYDLRLRLFSHLQRLSASFFDRTPVGRLVVRVTNDVENLNEMFTSGLVEFAADILLIAGTLAMMFWTNWKLALVTMAVAPVAFAAVALFRRHAREKYRDMRLKIARLNSCLNESVHGMRTIQTFGREGAALARFRQLNAEHRDSAVAALFAYSLFYPAVEALSSLALAGLVGYGGLRILEGSLTFGAFTAFWYYAYKFFMPVRELAEKYNILQAAMASSERVFGILDTPLQVQDRPDAVPAPPLRGEVAFENVSFSYDGKTPVLRDVSFRVEPGRTVAVVGATGAGKSTLINLLQRFYDPTSGRVAVDGRDVREFTIAGLRRQMGLVLQDVFFFAGTVEENLRLGEAIPRERLEAAARAVHADRLLARLPKGWETDVHERGASLSTGERQILSFARALAFDPRILILDEATSSVDAETERLIQDALAKLLKGRTSIVIAHRLSTVQRADRILVLHKGRVREEGTHAELLRLDGLYAKLHRLQFKPEPARPPAPRPSDDEGLAPALEGLP